MNLYTPTAHVKPHQDDLLSAAAAERLARSGRDDERRDAALQLRLLGAVARGASVVSVGAARLAAAADARQHHGHARS